jgi:hypothetical protein
MGDAVSDERQPFPVGVPTTFFGVDNNRFKLGDRVYEALEDECDGYRSYLRSVEVVEESPGIFFRTPIDTVVVRKVDSQWLDGWVVESLSDGHQWLEFGTDNGDDYYPQFRFTYSPRAPA